MIIIHRATSFLIGMVTAAGFVLAAGFSVRPLVVLPVMIVLVTALFARLIHGSPRHFQFWYFLGTPALFLVGASALLLFFETPTQGVTLGLVSAFLLFAFAEHLFTYVHTPVKYQAYAIEHLSLAMNVITSFFLAAAGFGFRLFLQLPLAALAVWFLLSSCFLIFGTLWVSKVEDREAWPYAIAGAVLATELFLVILFLPTGLYTNAALVALFIYLFLGLARARFTQSLERAVVRRYALIGGGMFIVILGSAKWM